MKIWFGIFLAIISGVLAAMAFPPLQLSWLCWIAWSPLIIDLWFAESKKHHLLRMLGLGYLGGIFFFWCSLAWIREVTMMGWFVLGLYLGIYPALWALFIGTICRPRQERPTKDLIWLNSWNNLWLAILGAAAWSGLEWIRGFLFTGFGWNSQGVALYRLVPLIQIADITGVQGLSFLVIMVNLIFVMTIKRLSLELRKYGWHSHFDFTITLALVAAAFLYGARKIFYSRTALTPIRIACIQPSIPQNLKWDPAFEEAILQTCLKQSEAAIRMHPNLLMWPEATTPRPALVDPETRALIEGVARSFSGDLLIGTIHFSGDKSFNSAVLFTDQGKKAQIYSKVHLVPFGEYIPLRHSFPLFAWIAGTLIPYDFTAGSGPVIFPMQTLPIHLAPLICFEDTIGSLARRFVLEKAQLFTVVTNNGWFGRSSCSQQHLANAIFRAAEFKIPMARCSNTGITCLVDRFGAISQILHDPRNITFGPGILVGELKVPSNPVPTFYARFGDVFSASALGLSCLAVIFHLRRRCSSRWRNVSYI